MQSFTPPTRYERGDGRFWGRFKVQVGLSVVKRGGHYHTTPYPWLGEIAELVEGEDWFQGGRTYEVTDEIALALRADGFTTDASASDDPGFGDGGFGEGDFGA